MSSEEEIGNFSHDYADGSASGYKLSIELSVLDHLGINLYSNVPAVLTELVANAWDADAKKVRIDVDLDADLITITDDGIGMTHDDINGKFLTVGYRRRNDEPDTTPSGRPVMGRKGLGKLAPFSIAGDMSIFSVKDGEMCGLRMNLADMEAVASTADQGQRGHYEPESLDHATAQMPNEGTRIELRVLKKKRVRVKDLRKRLARRFSVIDSEEFRVEIDGTSVTSRDRGDLDQCEYLWTIGDWEKPGWCDNIGSDRTATLPDRHERWPEDRNVRGWLATSRRPKDLRGAAGNVNGVVIISRGRLFQEDILSAIPDSRHFRQYLTGQIEADFLDASDESDLATSDRQRVIEDDERYQDVITYMRTVLAKLEREWNVWRGLDDPKQVEDHYPQVRNWIDGLSTPDLKKQAKRVIGTVEKMEVGSEEKRRSMLKYVIYGFERMQLRGFSDAFSTAVAKGSSQELLQLFADHDAVEAAAYRDIVSGRLDAIRALENAVDDNEKEKVLQQHLFKHLWLLDPSWERAVGSEAQETRLAKLFQEKYKSRDDKTSLGRVDITFQTIAGKHVIVELKRAGRRVSFGELADQGEQYVDDLQEILQSVDEPTNAAIEVVFVIGKPVPEQNPSHKNYDRYKSRMHGVSPGSRICHYNGLIQQAEKAYKAYLNATKKVGSLTELLSSLDGYSHVERDSAQ